MTFDPIAPSETPRQAAPTRAPALVRLLRRLGVARSRTDPDSLARRILLPSLPISDEEHARTRLHDAGQRLARQEDWPRLAARIAQADAARRHTPGGAPAADLLAEGARADAVAAATDAVADGRAPDPAGLDALERVRAEHADSYAIALVVAHTHMDIGRAWRTGGATGGATGTVTGTAAHDREARFLDHFRRAGDLLAPFDPGTRDAPSLAAAHCALLAARPAPRRRVADDYARLIALDPGCAQHLRALGAALLPARFGSHEEIGLAARRMAAQHGTAAYAWVWFDALALDPAGLGTVDPGAFTDGLRAIAAQRPDQHVINEIAAFCGLTMAPRCGPARLPAAPERARAAIHACLDWLVARHLHELHPLIWAQATTGPGPAPALPPRRTLIARGRQAALRVIAARFSDTLADGGALGFSSAGMYRLPGL
ncbi:hypothetical protein [Roseovarius ramblicola]|uniref:Uncharacterized protein n=1 Tax=Roseovarius ramblicola TaxID=2022336 RepID=A0ABV5HXS9_9RHOB